MKNKFNLIFIVGNEGTGHHLFNHLKINFNSNNLHKLIMTYFSVNTTPNQQEIIKKVFE